MGNYKELIRLASIARKNSYSPYSSFQVGACVELVDGNYIQGCNVENAAYGSTICAERNALFSTITKGYRKDDIKAIAIIASGAQVVVPCGACLQVFVELLNKDTPVILANDNTYIVKTVAELLPYAFTGENL